ncbi:MAG: MFS transporter [Sphaerochaetaceae bacterium]
MIYSKLGKNVYTLALLNFINGLGSFIFPFLSLFLIQKVGYSATKAGYFIMICSVLYVPSSLLSSKLSDKHDRKKIMVTTQLLFSVLIILSGAMIGNLELVPIIILVALIFDGATDPARSALFQDCTTLENRQVAFSLFYLSSNLGFGIGATLAGFLFNNYTELLFYFTGILGIVGALLVQFLVENQQPTHQELEKSKEGNLTDKAVEGNIFKALKARPNLMFYIIIMCGFHFLAALFYFGLPLYTTALFNKTGASNYGILMFVNAFVAVTLTPFITKLSKNIHPLLSIALAAFLYAISYFLFGLNSIFIVLVFIMIGNTIGEVFYATNSNYYVANHTPMGHRARFNSIMSILMGAGSAIGPYFSGVILDRWNFKTLFFIAGLGMLFIFIDLLILRQKDKI